MSPIALAAIARTIIAAQLATLVFLNTIGNDLTVCAETKNLYAIMSLFTDFSYIFPDAKVRESDKNVITHQISVSFKK